MQVIKSVCRNNIFVKTAFCVVLILFAGFTPCVWAQGCSDAGFCTAGAMQIGQQDNDTMAGGNSFGLSVTIGSGENATVIATPQVEGRLYLLSKIYLEGKLPVNIASGNLGAHTGLGDPILTCSRTMVQHIRFRLIASLGVRVGISNANASYNGVSLPMPYQNSLGTTDIISGINFSYGKYISASIGYQQPVVQYNENGYKPAFVYPAISNDHEYFASNHLKRKGDILIRAEGKYKWQRMSLSAGPLFIYHLGTDTYTDANGNRLPLTGSKGLTLNIAASIAYTMANGRIELLGGEPLVVRSYRPDGLTRSLVVTLRYTKF